MMMCILGLFGTVNAQKVTPKTTYPPITDVAASINEENNVDVIWSWNEIIPKKIVVDFETGNLNQADFDNNGNSPWTITTDAYEGNYAIKSTCEELFARHLMVETHHAIKRNIEGDGDF